MTFYAHQQRPPITIYNKIKFIARGPIFISSPPPPTAPPPPSDQIAPIMPAARLAQTVIMCMDFIDLCNPKCLCAYQYHGPRCSIRGCRVSMKMPIHYSCYYCAHCWSGHTRTRTNDVHSILRSLCSRTSPAVDFIRYSASSLCDIQELHFTGT